MSSKFVQSDRSPEPPDENRRDRELFLVLVDRVMRLTPSEEHAVRILADRLLDVRAAFSESCPPAEQWLALQGRELRMLRSQLRENAVRAALRYTSEGECHGKDRALALLAAIILAAGDHELVCDVHCELEAELDLARDDDDLDEQTHVELVKVVLSCSTSIATGPSDSDRAALAAALLRLKTSRRMRQVESTDAGPQQPPAVEHSEVPVLEITGKFKPGTGGRKRMVVLRGAKLYLPQTQIEALSKYVIAKRSRGKIAHDCRATVWRLRKWLEANGVTGSVAELNKILESAKNLPLETAG